MLLERKIYKEMFVKYGRRMRNAYKILVDKNTGNVRYNCVQGVTYPDLGLNIWRLRYFGIYLNSRAQAEGVAES
jgi:hypothetical protein